MDALTHAALIGTARVATDALTTDTPLDNLMANRATTDRERALLLRAGALAIYREAGLVPAQRTDPLPDPAPEEVQRSCSAEAATVVQVMLRHHPDLLPETLDRLIAHDLRLPAALVPVVLATRLPADLRPRLRRVLGARGQWLARFNSAWAWAVAAPLAGEDVPADAETIWQEGLPAQRIEVFARLRASDPARAREWLTEWRREKADMRADLLTALATNLSAADEPFLEAGLDDKVERVRDAAAAVLARLPTSAFVARMTARADSMLKGYSPGALHLAERIVWAADFARDGLSNDPPRGTAKSDWLLQQVLGNVPLAHWQQRLGADPADLITAAIGNPYEQPLVIGWSRAAQTHASAAWLAPLWDWWAEPERTHLTHAHLRDGLLAQMPQPEAEDRLLQMIDAGHEGWAHYVAALPQPWSAAFAQAYIARLQRYVADLAPEATGYDRNWLASFTAAAHGMAPAALRTLPLDLTLPETQIPAWQFEQWQRAWRELHEVATLRLRIVGEIVAATGGS